MAAKSRSGAPHSSANLGFEAKLWLAADKLRNNLDAAEYKHVVLGLIFLKYNSDHRRGDLIDLIGSIQLTDSVRRDLGLTFPPHSLL